MKRITILFLLFSNFIYSQELEISENINWKDSVYENVREKETLYFNGVDIVFENDYPIPYYITKRKIGINKAVQSIFFSNEEYKLAFENENKIIRNWNYDLSKIEIKYKITEAGNNSYLEIFFIPIKRNEQTENFLKLLNFTINVKLIESNIKSLQLKNWKNSSILNMGKWIKIAIKTTGIYKLSYNELSDMGLTNLLNIRVYGNSSGILSTNNADYRPDDLIENAIYLHDGGDGSFDEGDYILFYGRSPNIWKYDEPNGLFNFHRHLYSNYSYYFLTTDIGAGKRIGNQDVVSIAADNIVTTFNDYDVYEVEETNLIRSGKKWLGEHFYSLLSYDFSFGFPDRVYTQPINVSYSLVARSSKEYEKSSFDIIIGNQTKNVKIDCVNLGTHTGQFVQESNGTTSFITNGDDISLILNYNPTDNSSEGWLNYLELNVRRSLLLSGSQLHFRDANSVGIDNVSEFRIGNSNSNLKVWDITEPTNPKNIELNLVENTSGFKIQTDTLKEFIAFDVSSYLSVSNYEEIENQNLHGLEICDMIIVVKPALYDYASWISSFHENNDDLSSVIVDPEQIYNEYSSGMPDVSAIRDFVRHMYLKTGSNKLKYLLLFGDGSYDNRPSSITNTNYLLTYQSDNSFHYSQSFVTDDFFGLLHEDEGGSYGRLDIGIGRIPVLSATDAQTMIDKIESYYSIESFGDWRNVICFIADDSDDGQTFHMSDADKYSVTIENNYPVFNIDKIYLDAYPQESTPGGQRYPDVNRAINERVRKGALLINYTGHGNPKVLTDEQVVTVNDIKGWENFSNLPVFITATCEFSRYDDKNRVSAGEYIMNNAEGGAIAMLTTSRLVYAGSNDALNTNFYDHVFTKDENGKYFRLGDIVKLTKIETGLPYTTNRRNFSLLGDPALQLAIPEFLVKTDKINDTSVEYINDSLVSLIDTLNALSKVTICGHLEDIEGNILNTANGILYPTIFDKARLITTLSNDGFPALTYSIQNNILYKGKVSVNNGRFDFEFIVPRDISYNYGNGKLSYYFANDEYDARGHFSDVAIGGSSDSVTMDNYGPQVELYLNDENFINGGTTNSEPMILAILTDSTGINTVGNGIGHDITVTLDNNTSNVLVLNDYYEADLDSYKSGRIEYVLSGIEEGNHNMKLKVWDIYNNPAEEFLDFIVVESEDLALNHVFNYPNPFTTETAFYFDHNQPNTDLDVIVQVFTVTGKLVKSISQTINTTGFRNEPIFWNGLDDYGDRIGRGVYIYRVKVQTPEGKNVEKFEKLVILK